MPPRRRADRGLRFGAASHFVGFEVNDEPARPGTVEQIHDAALIGQIITDFVMTFGGFEFGEECVRAQAFQQSAGFLNCCVDFLGVSQA